MTPTVAQMRQHALDLAKAFNVPITLVPNLPVHQSMSQKTGVTVPDITADSYYAIALHELGHSIAPTGQLHHEQIAALEARDFARLGRLCLTEEESAWEWAHHYALDWTLGMEVTENYSIGHYRKFTDRERGLMLVGKQVEMHVQASRLDSAAFLVGLLTDDDKRWLRAQVMGTQP